MSLLDKPIGELAATIPGATRLFDENKLDYCFNGQQTLRQTLKSININHDSFLSQLDALDLQKELANHLMWSAQPTASLITHIIDNFHEKHRQQFPELIQLIKKITLNHPDHPELPKELESHLVSMEFELQEHMMKEEEILFPLLMNGFYPAGPISVMEAEHLEHAKALEKLADITHQFTPPDGVCSSWQALYVGVEQLYYDLKEHIHLENNILFIEQ